MNRRRFLRVLGAAGGGAAALSGCSTDRVEKLIPYLVPPENQIPGIATWYASSCRECPAGCGLHIRVREGRAVKVEGNPEHPINQGRLCARGQASLQGLYNPDRVRGPLARGANGGFEAITWEDAVARIATELQAVTGDQIRFVTANETGTFGRLVDEWLSVLGSSGRVSYEPFGYEALRYANQQVFGLDAVPQHDFAAARYVLSFGADFLETWLSPVEYARGFAEGHSYQDGAMGRYVHIEPRMSMTGMSADEWIAPVPGTEALIALAMARVIVRDRLATPPTDLFRIRTLLEAHGPDAVASRAGVPADTIERLAREFTAEPSVALAGGVGAQHDQAHYTAAAVSILNYVAGNVGRTVTFAAQPPLGGAGRYADLAALARAMRNGAVGVLFLHGANPAYAAPAGLGFADAMRQVGFKVSFARFLDETATGADLILPDYDPLEQWNDYEPRAGVHTLQQPVMQPVFDTRQSGDVLLEVAQQMGGRIGSRFTAANYMEYLQQAWRALQRQLRDRRPFETFWNESLQRGGVWQDVPQTRVRLARSAGQLAEVPVWSVPAGQLTLVAYPSPALYDGRGANRPWLQELPDPVTKITWSSWIELHPDTAADRGIAEGDILEVSSPTGTVQAPAYLYPGVRPDVIALPLGQGHTALGRYAEGRGANAYALLSPNITEFGGVGYYAAVTLRHTGVNERLPKTEGKPRQLGRGIAEAVTLRRLTGEEPHEAEHEGAHAAPVPEHIEEVLREWQEAQYREQERGDYAGDHPRWAMAIDLSKCTGCSACVTACYAENNIPTVGPELVRRGREMSWMRIERYFEGGENGHPLEARVVPMLCQHCGNAPCEPVCPVFAAYHTPDGLNGQIYNRCVGTRYCSNNCPYKVRYFNWFDHQHEADPAFAWPEPLHWLLNPDVTVRVKGVMEKCTFCVQRIRGKQHEAKLANRELQDGEVLVACQQSCPSDAIVFGDLRDPNSRVSQLAGDERGYHVFEDLNIRPAVTYLSKVRNITEVGG
ncbi:MAG: molybdopterin-dependent oxidoreductase [Gemmatimonadales bacterium]|nr:molybdopterin-dependent oxidoreductase [Gemmatimonadales bacterium]NIN13316.1 molybdopterin-dependent oxidoreductase [Gemmatimonadales bacterium]NIN51319.1 molybdopterin-dependent oxidoreductase [Gemmatimonadales bacterium]NIP08783.1 molybdopterin-dependent oxidoreductase [Gemmatimonadales bacterium]NIQ99777.1 molybdopterin-dependent oxidoreductase [Gemmatimonadales bacterium]